MSHYKQASAFRQCNHSIAYAVLGSLKTHTSENCFSCKELFTQMKYFVPSYQER